MRPSPKHVRFCVALLAFAAHSAPARAAAPPADVQFQKDLVYGIGGGQELKLNLSRPKNPAAMKLPCVVVIHGGGWVAGDRATHDDITWALAQRGYVVATVGYRLAPAQTFPAQVEDVKCAVRFLRANAKKFGLDPDHVGAVGFSAGGHLSMMLGVTDPGDGLEGQGGHPDQSSRVQAVVSYYGPTDLTAGDWPDASKNILTTFIGGTLAEKREAYRRASPLTYVSAGDAPMLLFQGTKDPLVPHTQTYPLIDAMTRAGVPGRVELLAGADHGWGGPELLRTAHAALAFFEQYLRPK
jgi:acetyl esterase/lipase